MVLLYGRVNGVFTPTPLVTINLTADFAYDLGYVEEDWCHM